MRASTERAPNSGDVVNYSPLPGTVTRDGSHAIRIERAVGLRHFALSSLKMRSPCLRGTDSAMNTEKEPSPKRTPKTSSAA